MHIPSILKGPDMPKHLAITANNIKKWADKNSKALEDALKKHSEKIHELIGLQQKKDIPILTINVPAGSEEEISHLKKLFDELSENDAVHNSKVRVYVIGDWYELDADFSDSIKKLMDRTRKYDNYFLCFCVNYNGREELLTAVRLLLRKTELKELKVEELNIETFKDNIPSSYFPAPEIIIENNKSYSGLLLWDSVGSIVYFTGKNFLDFERKDFDKAIDFFNEQKKK